ncbi:VOC family protein [Actinomadura miaoliensis]|uniref:VOC family protein n=1 Tax=Actinomadura miaoliensis TaxID=430685 RepID=A0ABP7VK81_9ACTN
MSQSTAGSPHYPFHHTFPVSDLDAARHFYGTVLGCPEARKKGAERAADFDFFGHHIVVRLVEGDDARLHRAAAEGANIAVRHFGVVLPWPEWEAVAERLAARSVAFVVEPTVRHRGEPHEEAMMMLADPFGNGLEFKAFRDLAFLWGRQGGER